MKRSRPKEAATRPDSQLRRHVCRPRAALTAIAFLLTFCGSPTGNGSPPVDTPRADFTATCSALSCSFTDGSSDADGTIVSRIWDFGDGSTSIEINPQHSYAQTGIYSATLRVVDDSGATGASSHGIVVGDAGLVLIGAGDIADCSNGSKATAAVIAQYPTAAVFTLGDNAYENGSAANYSQCYEPTWGTFKDRTRPAPGNHDYNTPGAAGYFGYFGAAAGPSGRGYYSYDLGSWHIVSLDSEIDASATSSQASWLKQDLAAHPAACTLAYWHKPLFTSGANHAPEAAMRPLFTILYDAGADVVLSGHNHQYERFAPQRPDGTLDDSRGIRELVAGTGGAGLYAFATPQANSQVRYRGYGVVKLTLGPTSYAWEFVPVAGSSFTDGGVGTCH